MVAFKTIVPAHLFFWFLLSSLVNFLLKVWRDAVIDIECDSDSVKKDGQISMFEHHPL